MTACQKPTTEEEDAARRDGHRFVAGVDEAGCGCWAGSVFAAAVILPEGWTMETVRDSKTLSAAQRERTAEAIKAAAIAWAVGTASAEEIDSMNIRRAAGLAMRRAVEALSPTPDMLLIDAFKIPGVDIPQRNIIRGDAKVLSIAAASIIAKVSRDAECVRMAKEHPGYGFENHKGYGTKEHQAALEKMGPCVAHRKSYEPVKRHLEKNGHE
ncbi:MAG: ribonuclease HII [Patescibacteria group bacterium]|nr:ribonuclease HII [Patescibacteria group bacterium]